MEPISLLSQFLALVSALTVGLPPHTSFPAGIFAHTVVRAATDPIYGALGVIEKNDVLPPLATDLLDAQVQDSAFVSEAVIEASVRIPVTIRSVPINVKADVAAGVPRPEAVTAALGDVGVAIQGGKDNTAHAIKVVHTRRSLVAQTITTETADVAKTVLSAQGEVRGSAVDAAKQVAVVIRKGGDTSDVRKTFIAGVRDVKQTADTARGEVDASAAEATARIRKVIKGTEPR